MKRYLSLVCVLILLVTSLALTACNGGDIPEPEPKISALLQTQGEKLVIAETGEEILLQGVNLGGWLVREGWLCPMNTYDASGAEQEYTDLAAFELLNARFGEERASELFEAYMDNWLTESDLDNLQACGFNCVRLSFAWYNLFALDDYTLREDAFDRLDWLYGECAERGIYIVLDLHGAIGSQNGQHHSGDTTQSALFTTEDYMAKTVLLWQTVAEHFKTAEYVAGYDLLNEPEGGYQQGTTGTVQWDFYDRLYDAIRAIDTTHIVIMEAVWKPTALPKPAAYGWENVMYEIHCYDWGTSLGATDYWQEMETYWEITDVQGYDVPWYVGEFNCFDEASEWQAYVEYFQANAVNWTVWNYKACSDGFTCWGLYSGGGEALRANLNEDSYDTIMNKWTACATGASGRYTKNETLWNTVKDYLV